MLHVVSWNVAGWRTCVTEMSRCGMEDWMDRLDCDVLCVQETKVRSKQVADDVTLRRTKKYESYWSCNEGKGAQRAGLNGVATFSRLPVVSADPGPLGDAELDAEGRALLTDFGDFVLLNIYAPNGSSAERQEIQRRFYEACKRLVLNQTKPIIVAGDFNSTKRCEDSHWSFGRVDLSKLPDVSDRVKVRQVVTKNSKTGEEFLKYKLFCDENKPVGQPRATEDDCRYDDPATCAEIFKTLGVDVTLEYLPRARPNPLFEILEDPFETLYPLARERFTCWDQRTNRRYENVGARIDYILCDSTLLKDPVKDSLLKNSPADALDDATLSGAFRPAPYEGGGVPEAPRHAYRAHLMRSKATTIIYTPPAWSDHVAVSLCVSRKTTSPSTTGNESACRRAQPHKSTRSITHFFKPQEKRSSQTNEKPEEQQSATKKPKKGALFRYFQPAKDASS